jgi:superfamily II DNA helicase RecQ
MIAAEDAIHHYTIFTDAELAEIAKLEHFTPAQIAKIKGIGDKKIENFVPRIIKYYDEAGKSSDEQGA